MCWRLGSNAQLSWETSMGSWTSHWPALYKRSLHNKGLEMCSVVPSPAAQGSCADDATGSNKSGLIWYMKKAAWPSGDSSVWRGTKRTVVTEHSTGSGTIVSSQTLRTGSEVVAAGQSPPHQLLARGSPCGPIPVRLVGEPPWEAFSMV